MADNSRPFFVVLLLAIAACGCFGVMGLGELDGFFQLVNDIRESASPQLPGTKDPLLQKYSGFKPLDGLFTVLTIIFQPVVDGLSPATSLFALEFYGQVAALTTILMIESFRAGNKGRVVSL